MSKFSERITLIKDMVPHGSVEHVYDLCCDHGLIGLAIFKSYPELKVTFVDRIPSIMENLKKKLAAYITVPEKIAFFTQDARELEINLKTKNLYIISGIGADLAIEIFNNLIAQDKGSYYLFCIHQKNEYLKEHLIDHGLRIVKNHFIIDKKHGYEIMLTHTKKGNPIQLFDPKIYDRSSIEHKAYLIKLKNYYETKSKHEDNPKFQLYFKDLEAILATF